MKYVLMFVETEQFHADLEAMDAPERERAGRLAASLMPLVGAEQSLLRQRLTWT